jgi:DNA-binding transcriptional ArsR family regulator
MPRSKPTLVVSPAVVHGSNWSEDYERVAEIFSALASPVRAAIIHRLAVKPRTVSELVAELDLSQPLISQHLKTLRQTDLIAVERTGRTATYRVSDEHVIHIFLDAYQHSMER